MSDWIFKGLDLGLLGGLSIVFKMYYFGSRGGNDIGGGISEHTSL